MAGKNSKHGAFDAAVCCKSGTSGVVAAVAVEKWTQAAAYKLRTTYFGAAAPRPKVLGGADPMAGQNSTRRAFGAAVRCKSGTYSVAAAVAVEKWTQAAAYKLRTTNFTSEAPELGIAN